MVEEERTGSEENQRVKQNRTKHRAQKGTNGALSTRNCPTQCKRLCSEDDSLHWQFAQRAATPELSLDVCETDASVCVYRAADR